MTFDVVVAADLDWGIGKAGGLPWPKLRTDLRHFKQLTTTASAGRRNAVVMGRKTWESTEVARRALPNRLNVVMSRGPYEVPPGVVTASSLGAALAVPDVERVFVVGGAGLLVEALAHPDLGAVYLTRIAARFGCDVAMPDLDARGFAATAWEGAQEVEEAGLRYAIARWVSAPTRHTA
jgi:dihydrofolate reductase